LSALAGGEERYRLSAFLKTVAVQLCTMRAEPEFHVPF